MSFRVEPSDESESSFSPVEKGWSIPLYVVRKLVFYSGRFACRRVEVASDLFGFRFEWELKDEPRWRWLEGFSLPRYGLQKKN